MNKNVNYRAIMDKVPFAIILVCALLPRLFQLDAFLTMDEYLWLDRSRNFLLALKTHDWAHTFQTGHPGVTTMWSGSLGLWLYGFQHDLIQRGGFIPFLQNLSWDHQNPEIFAYLRLPIALVTALGIVGIAYLLTRLFDKQVGMIAGLLLALDPWYLAHSRVLHHDALMTTFMTLSALALLLYVWRESGRWALFLSGICAGVALLSKALGLFILPWAALMFLIALGVQKWPIQKVLSDGVMWAMMLWMTFFILWPAMWLRPANTLLRMRTMVTTYAINPHAKGQFFLGERVADPGWGFYPIVAAFAMTPLVMLGISALPIILGEKKDRVSIDKVPVLLLGLYIVAFTIFVNLGEKKQDRYWLAALVMLNILAAIGLRGLLLQIGSIMVKWFSRFSKIASSWSRNTCLGLIMTVVTVIQLATCLPHHPYYSTYYNPLLGGTQAAARYLLVGWGEGNALAAEYLNALPDAQEMTVVADMTAAFAPYFEGESWLWWPQTTAFAADYVVLNQRDVQRGQPDPHIVNYIQRSWHLEQSITLHGLPYVWIYRAPAADWILRRGEKNSLMHRLDLLAYEVSPTCVTVGQEVTVTLYFRQQSVAGRWVIRLQNAQETWEAQNSTLQDDLSHTESQMIFEEVHSVELTSEVEPGVYQVNLGFQHESETEIRWLPFFKSSEVRVLVNENCGKH
jgi:4-amino-4-deoxy-L-arabinose transferase-like glycosyltransferase